MTVITPVDPLFSYLKKLSVFFGRSVSRFIRLVFYKMEFKHLIDG